MAKLNVSPTRMNLTTLKKRLATSVRGHKLLKDKQDELMRRFIEIVKKNKVLREEVERELSGSFKDFLLASAFISPEILEEALMFPTQKINLDITIKNVMSVEIPEMEFIVEETAKDGSIYPYGYAQTTADVDDAIDKLNKILQKLLELAQIEKSVQLMASEIESTRRRVNALEYRTIPDLQETIRYIMSKLDENERANITRLMKVKDIITKESSN
ncbi:V-type ATP synthase subunit D [Anaerosphaera multitolerans]|uniref:V-type ATP synthase subunit D n=1 Tax=Anaerosphaera multitolerans TaxID=2487351 RepID=A0A437S4J5_9FIRM|nr:V-type ATP synthase subunit D [Anaerosphaera multitolerans]RVU53931.1 V-type ATP synthase subunit D [Anaerosphaera multitolerans]